MWACRGAVRADLALAYGEGGHERMREAFQTCLLLITGTGLPVTAGFVALVNGAPLGWIGRGSALSAGDAAFIASVLAVQIAMSLVLGVFQAALSAVGRYGYVGFLESNRQAAEFIGLLVTVGLLRKSPVIACLIYPVTMALHLGVLIGRVQIDAPWVLQGPWRFHRTAMQRLWKPMLGVLATSFGYYSLSFQAPRVILGIVAGPTAVAVYAVTAMLMRIVRMPIDIVAHTPSVELSMAYGSGERQRARNILSGAMRSCFWIALCMIPFILLFGPTAVGRLDAPPGGGAHVAAGVHLALHRHLLPDPAGAGGADVAGPARQGDLLAGGRQPAHAGAGVRTDEGVRPAGRSRRGGAARPALRRPRPALDGEAVRLRPLRLRRQPDAPARGDHRG